ncbi:RepA leader peptide Tap [Escherichia coli]|nr:RepA leader peptide Tap [Escherichia coli]PBT06801.1 RepA leader peptide Tap [Escherichia coli]PBT08136.1 RepA leader peptide Tap [Escherichia coli]PBT13078.1 RepA leader peptide Tap [Escherichia coli]PBT17550.1 RepA leader peptide Tap [Escherichia coli]
MASPERLPGLTRNRIEAVALCGEYSYMPGKVQDFFLWSLLLRSISAGWCG